MEEVRKRSAMRFGPAVLIAASALLSIAAAVLVALHSIQSTPDGALHDTYFIVAFVPVISITMLTALIMTLVHVLNARRLRSRLEKTLLWAQAIAAAVWLSAQAGSWLMLIPGSRLNVERSIERWILVDTISSLGLVVAVVLLIAILLLVAFKRFIRTS